jgi:hypothetical protein
LKIELPLSAAKQTPAAYQFGLGTAAVGIKVNFYNDENRGVGVSVYPQMKLSTGGGLANSAGDHVHALVLPILIAKEFSQLSAVFNAGVEIPFHTSDERNTEELGIGVGRAFFRKTAVMAELRSSSTVDFKEDRTVSTNIGVIYGVRRAIWYARAGHTLISNDGPHAFFAIGMKVLVDTKRKS